MARNDIRIGIDVDTSNLKQGLDQGLTFITDSLGELRSIAQEATTAFSDLEKTAAEAGRTLEEFHGISRDVADSYRDVVRENSAFARAMKVLLVETMSPTIRAFSQMAIEVRNVGRELKEIGKDDSLLETLTGIFGGKQSRRIGAIGGGISRALGLSESRATIEVDQSSDIKGEHEKIKEELEERRQKAIASSERRANRGSASVKDRFASITDRLSSGLERGAQNRALATQFKSLDQALFSRLQGVDRDSFIQQQQLDLQDRGGVPEAVFKARQAQDLQKFDQSQTANSEKQSLRDAVAAQKAALQTEKNTKNLLAEFKKAVLHLAKIAARQQAENKTQTLEELAAIQ